MNFKMHMDNLNSPVSHVTSFKVFSLLLCKSVSQLRYKAWTFPHSHTFYCDSVITPMILKRGSLGLGE